MSFPSGLKDVGQMKQCYQGRWYRIALTRSDWSWNDKGRYARSDDHNRQWCKLPIFVIFQKVWAFLICNSQEGSSVSRKLNLSSSGITRIASLKQRSFRFIVNGQ
jgi:hypothetical protein